MAEEPTPVEEAPATPDTPPEAEVSGTQPEAGTPAEEQQVDWEARYKDLQSTYTKTSQEAAQLREAQQAREAESSFVEALSNPEQSQAAWASLVEQLGEDDARKWAEAHGFEVADDGSNDTEVRDPRVDQLLSERQQEQEQAQIAEVEQQMESKLDELMEKKGLKKDDPELVDVRDVILDAAVMRPTKDGDPDVEGVFNAWAKREDASIKAYRAGKRDQPTPPVPGSSGTPNPSLGDRSDRIARANAIAERVFQSS